MYSGEVGKTRKLLSKLLIFSVDFISLILSDCPGVYPTTSCGDILRKEEVLTRKYLLASAVSSFLFDLSEFLQRIFSDLTTLQNCLRQETWKISEPGPNGRSSRKLF